MKSKELTRQHIWKKYQKCLDFNKRIELYETVEVNENFFIGKQWEGVQSNGLPTPVFNMLKQIVQHQVASITSDNIKMNASPLRAAANDQELDKVMSIVNDEIAAIMERNKITVKLRQFARNAAVDGDGVMFSYWDDENDMIQTEVLENVRVFFGNPNNRDVQSQPYIIIALRDLVDNVKDRAEESGEPEKVTADTDDYNSYMYSLTDNMVTRLLYLWKDKETKTIHAFECTKDAIVREEWDMDIRLYPITWLNWDYVQNSYHGQALITGLIPNQEFVNKAYAMTMLSLMMSAFPKTVYDKNRVSGWTNQIGAQIGVNGDVTNIARIIEPAQISPQVAQFIASAIEHTQSFTGATAAALGNTRPDNTSAIVALQRAASIPSEITKQNLYQCLEDLGRIWVEFMAANYGTKKVDANLSDMVDPAMMQFAGIPTDKQVQVEFDFKSLKEIPMYMCLDVGASAYWSEIASQQTLDNLLQLGQIDIVDYLERIPDGYVAKRMELLNKYKAKMAQAMQPQFGMGMPMPEEGNDEGDIASMGQQEEIVGGKGNRNLQRAMTESV